MVLGSVHLKISCFYASTMENVSVFIMIWNTNLLDITIMQQLVVIEVP
jgi:hypothetical protein